MLRRTLALSAVNVVTAVMVFLPIAEVVSEGMEDTYYLHSTSPPYFFIAQLALGIFAVIIDMFNAKPHLQSKLLASAVAISGTLVGVTLWLGAMRITSVVSPRSLKSEQEHGCLLRM